MLRKVSGLCPEHVRQIQEQENRRKLPKGFSGSVSGSGLAWRPDDDRLPLLFLCAVPSHLNAGRSHFGSFPARLVPRYVRSRSDRPLLKDIIASVIFFLIVNYQESWTAANWTPLDSTRSVGG